MIIFASDFEIKATSLSGTVEGWCRLGGHKKFVDLMKTCQSLWIWWEKISGSQQLLVVTGWKIGNLRNSTRPESVRDTLSTFQSDKNWLSSAYHKFSKLIDAIHRYPHAASTSQTFLNASPPPAFNNHHRNSSSSSTNIIKERNGAKVGRRKAEVKVKSILMNECRRTTEIN